MELELKLRSFHSRPTLRSRSMIARILACNEDTYRWKCTIALDILSLKGLHGSKDVLAHQHAIGIVMSGEPEDLQTRTRAVTKSELNVLYTGTVRKGGIVM